MGAGAGDVDRRRHPHRQLLRGLGDLSHLPGPGRRAAAGGAGARPARTGVAAVSGAGRGAPLRRRLGGGRHAWRRCGGDRALGAGLHLARLAPGLRGSRRLAALGDLRDGRVDTWLVAGDLLQGPNSVLSAAAPAADLPRLQAVHFGSAAMGFGDLFVAALVGCLLALPPTADLAGDRGFSPAGSCSAPAWWPFWLCSSTCSSSRSTRCRRPCRSPSHSPWCSAQTARGPGSRPPGRARAGR